MYIIYIRKNKRATYPSKNIYIRPHHYFFLFTLMSFWQRLVESQKKRAAAAAALFTTTGKSPPSSLIDVLTPRDAELTQVLASVVQEIADHDYPTNSQKAMDPKKEEWIQFCDALYPVDPYRHIINSDKCYRSMCYQSFRESKKKDGEKSLLKKYVFTLIIITMFRL